ncbi:hypothetical protein [Litchfieldia alkalitelluris]|uniref:hypothetical protein n=1 Tax=Litchfieldia alkalitelluris TaxID=304268 RepID=UPI0009988C8E|nr:hypothetical protein [Litchfieldia alkalitelluris]
MLLLLMPGLISGITLGVFLNFVEILTEKQVYRLLLNVDFIPIINKMNYPEMVEFIFHLIISLAIGILLHYIIVVLRLSSRRALYSASFLITVPTIFLYFPLSLVSYQPITQYNDVYAFTLWTIGHLVYWLVLTYSEIKINQAK